MARRSFEMYEIRQIIVYLRAGQTIRGIAQTKLANRKKIRVVYKIAVQQNWLDKNQGIPTDEVLTAFFKQTSPNTATKSRALPYTLGSVRGAASDSSFYRDPCECLGLD